MKAVAWTALFALIVSIPFLLRRRNPARGMASRATNKLDDRLYENEDFFA